ncbi:protein YIF1A isoform X2 [Anolis carolinensis]|uniref:protein YIF1A isoform X2 n=1 Tax=Anolis carolinensis TaxID=28377 RepID=UPI002F2B370A
MTRRKYNIPSLQPQTCEFSSHVKSRHMLSCAHLRCPEGFDAAAVSEHRWQRSILEGKGRRRTSFAGKKEEEAWGPCNMTRDSPVFLTLVLPGDLESRLSVCKPTGSKHRTRVPPMPQSPDAPQLFDDTSSTYGLPQAGYPTPGIDMGFNQIFADPVANVAMAYGTSIASQGKDIMHKEIHRFMSINKLKYFFAVDTTYVMKKLALLVFPYMHQNWEVRYHRDLPLTPRQDVNAPDLYIPSMAFITYILLAGMALGLQKRFSPEVLGMCASTAFVWVVIEVLALLLGLYLATVHSDLGTFDLLAYCGYKYVGMILAVIGGLIFGSNGYYIAWAWASCALMYFMVRSLRMKILPSMVQEGLSRPSGRAQMYVTLAAAAFQPLILYWLTVQLVH